MTRTHDLKGERVAIDAVRPHPHNARQGDVAAISESLRIHGQYRPIVVQKATSHIVAGNHTWQAAQSLGWKEIDVTWIDVDDDEALRILLVDNRSNDLASYDDAALAELLKSLADDAGTLEGTGFDEDDLAELLGDTEPFDPSEHWRGMPEFEHDDQRPHRSIHVHFSSEEAVQNFQQLIGQEFSEKARWIWHPRQVREDFHSQGWRADEP